MVQKKPRTVRGVATVCQTSQPAAAETSQTTIVLQTEKVHRAPAEIVPVITIPDQLYIVLARM